MLKVSAAGWTKTKLRLPRLGNSYNKKLHRYYAKQRKVITIYYGTPASS